MNSDIIFYKEGTSNDEIIHRLNGLMDKFPFSNVLQGLFFQRTKVWRNNVPLMLSLNDRTFLHYTTMDGIRIPDIMDLNDHSKVEIGSYTTNIEADQVLPLPETINNAVSIVLENAIDEESSSRLSGSNGDPVFKKTEDTEEKGKSDQKPGKKEKNKKGKFKLSEFSGVSLYAQWLLGFKHDNLQKKISKEEKKAKKRIIEENAKKSIQKSSLIISEPLAQILASQGHFDDAKKMYEQLMMKYPEKSSYFAAKINNLIKI